MANFIVTYDLNGPHPSHEEMDVHLRQAGVVRGRVAETVWYVAYPGTYAQLRDYVALILGPEDLLLVVEGKEAAWTRLLCTDDAFYTAWNLNR
jgi:hypothetical protein